MSMARLVVTAVLAEGRSKSEVARDYKVSRRWVVTLVQRFLAEGEAGLEPRSRRPKRIPGQLAVEIEDEIVAVRKELTELGHDAGAHTIAFHLERRHGGAPSPSTIWRVLTRRGFIVPEPHKRPKSSYVRFEADQPNERWQLDITHWRLAAGIDVEILNIIDDHSRLVVGSDARPVFKAADVVGCFRKATDRFDVPAQMLSDNGAVFTGIPRGGGRVALELELIALGVTFRHSRPYHPQTCGKVERFHQTLKNWLDRQPPTRSVPRPASPTRPVRPLLQHPAAPPRVGTAHTRRGLPGQTQSHRLARTRARPPLPGAPRPRQRRRHHPAPQQPAFTTSDSAEPATANRPGPGPRPQVRILTEQGELLRQLTLDPTTDYQPQQTS